MAALRVKLMDFIKPGTALGRHVHLAADDGFDSLCLAGAVEINRAVHHTVVCDRAGGLPHLLDDLRQIPDAAGSVQEAIFCMDMQMDKRHGHYSSLSASPQYGQYRGTPGRRPTVSPPPQWGQRMAWEP